MLLLIAFALAHLPHDVVPTLAAPPDVSPQAPWFAVVAPARSTALYRSLDGGRNWLPLGGAPTADLLLEAVMLSDWTLVLRSDRHLWWSHDVGETWEKSDLPTDIISMGGSDTLILGTQTGLWMGPPGGPYTESPLGGPILGIRSNTLGTVVWSENSIWSLSQNTPTLLSNSFFTITQAVLAAEGLYAGDNTGKIWHWNGDWQPCGSIPIDAMPSSADFPQIRGLGVVGPQLWVMPAWGGPFVSEDNCQQFEDRRSPMLPSYSISGSAQTAEQGVSGFYVGSSILVGGWDGVAASQTSGQSWQDGYLLGADYTRGIGFAANWPVEPQIYIGSLGAGVLRTQEDGRNPVPGAGLADANTQGVFPSSDPAIIYATIGHLAYKSSDSGATWAPVGNFSYAAAIKPWTPTHLWVGGVSMSGQGGLWESNDGGHTFTLLPEVLSSCSDFFEMPSGEICVVSRQPVQEVLCGNGEVWESRWVTDSTIEAAVQSGDTLMLADAKGVWQLENQTATLLWENSEDPVLNLAWGGNQLYASTRAAHLWRGTGTVWEEMGVQFPTEATTLVASPDWEQDPFLLVATLDGLFRIDSPATTPRVSPWAPTEWVDDHASMMNGSAYLHQSADGMHMDSVTLVALGENLKTAVQGHRVRLWGLLRPQGEGFLMIDGVERAHLIGPSQSRVSILSTIDDLGEGWHEVEIIGSGLGIEVDGVEGIQIMDIPETDDSAADTAPPESRPRPPLPQPEDPECGCNKAGAAWLLLPFLLGWRRRKVF